MTWCEYAINGEHELDPETGECLNCGIFPHDGPMPIPDDENTEIGVRILGGDGAPTLEFMTLANDLLRRGQ